LTSFLRALQAAQPILKFVAQVAQPDFLLSQQQVHTDLHDEDAEDNQQRDNKVRQEEKEEERDDQSAKKPTLSGMRGRRGVFGVFIDPGQQPRPDQ
jgi:hypothetical protein